MTDEQTAAKIMSMQARCTADGIEAAIVRALQAARTPPPGHIIDDAGVVRKVLGTLPLTKDGCVVGLGEGAQIWNGYWHDFPPDCGGRQWIVGQWPRWRMDGEHLASIATYYSTPEAAEAAKEGKA